MARLYNAGCFSNLVAIRGVAQTGGRSMKPILRSLLSLLILMTCFFPSAAVAQRGSAGVKPPLDGFDDFMAQILKDWKVPGVGVAVVQNGEVILLKGYGYRDVEKTLPVTPQTLFPIGSITKSFTVSTLGMEMDEGKVDWDKPVRNCPISGCMIQCSLSTCICVIW
jgi:CubicO group peptidase (beta-lactamase class C family)